MLNNFPAIFTKSDFWLPQVDHVFYFILYLSTCLPAPLHQNYKKKKKEIKARLNDFTTVHCGEYFYELAFCLLTPQSSQANAEKVIEELKAKGFREKPFNPTPHLRNPKHYIRFHNVKSARLLELRKIFPQIYPHLLNRREDPRKLRALLLKNVNGLGWKEASHFLRNIGFRDLAILDRHILKHLQGLRVIGEIPKSLPPRKYLDIEESFFNYATKINVPMDELDLLFWSEATGEIKK